MFVLATRGVGNSLRPGQQMDTAARRILRMTAMSGIPRLRKGTELVSLKNAMGAHKEAA